ncbi:YicC family protein [Bacillus sp. M6-12]|uniref:YicC/YloC family endoribonuclease n=1 Tax=Bacillus sp. M6-12 TaxID=2054166 RepID=UPI000C782049|nr:YicC/YloC family endoribonuclease [Bacillus sp. M6-12]PLS16841.1 YicC family protein [Bacillus sp. M6-12]
MAVSMTGYGRGKAESDSLIITVEMKTVNHRFSEYNIRMPRQFLMLEERIKKTANQYIRRGRADIFVTVEGEGLVTRNLKIDWKLADQYFEIASQAQERYGLNAKAAIEDLLHINDIFTVEEKEAQNEEAETILLAAVTDALEALLQMRMQEGILLANDLRSHLHKITGSIASLADYAPVVSKQYGERLAGKLNDFLAGSVDENRLLTEAAIFADKADISEELTRLESHVIQFHETLELHEPIGRKLDFLVQEMNREVNTIGSKANDSKITKEVVEMKSLLEKMKEQVQNIE